MLTIPILLLIRKSRFISSLAMTLTGQISRDTNFYLIFNFRVRERIECNLKLKLKDSCQVVKRKAYIGSRRE